MRLFESPVLPSIPKSALDPFPPEFAFYEMSAARRQIPPALGAKTESPADEFRQGWFVRIQGAAQALVLTLQANQSLSAEDMSLMAEFLNVLGSHIARQLKVDPWLDPPMPLTPPQLALLRAQNADVARASYDLTPSYLFTAELFGWRGVPIRTSAADVAWQ